MTLDLSWRHITQLHFKERYVVITFEYEKEEIKVLPPGLTALYCWNNKLTRLENLPPRLTRLDCSGNKLTLLENLPLGLIELYCSGNKLTLLENLPSGLAKLYCSYNQLTRLENLPSNLIWMDCQKNELIFIEPIRKRPEYYWFPPSLEKLHNPQNYPKYYDSYQSHVQFLESLMTYMALEVGCSYLILDSIKHHHTRVWIDHQ